MRMTSESVFFNDTHIKQVNLRNYILKNQGPKPHHYLFSLSRCGTVGPTDSNWVVSKSLLFRTQDPFPWICLSIKLPLIHTASTLDSWVVIGCYKSKISIVSKISKSEV